MESLNKSFLWLILLVFILAAGCSKDEESAEDAPGNAYDGESKEPQDIGEKTSGGVYPLTGEKTDDGDARQRMIGVMVNNHPDARPQTGLSQADMVFEILAEGRITRFLALFQSELPEAVGPVRSAREYYFDLADDYDALYVYHGAANFVDDMIDEDNIEHINGSNHDDDGRLFKRDTSREAPHNSYLQMDAVNDEAEDKGYDTTFDYDPLPFLTDDEADDIDGEDAEDLNIVYSERYDKDVSFHYDPDEEAYMRSSESEKNTDRAADEQIGVDNVLVMEASHEVIDDEGRRAVDMEDGGDAYLLQKGTKQEVEWKNDEGRIIAEKDGETIPFAPGQTWINVIPTDPGLDDAVSISADSE